MDTPDAYRARYPHLEPEEIDYLVGVVDGIVSQAQEAGQPLTSLQLQVQHIHATALSKKLRALRLELTDLTQEEAAARAEWSVSKQIRMENGKTLPFASDIYMLATIYGLGDDIREELISMRRELANLRKS